MWTNGTTFSRKEIPTQITRIFLLSGKRPINANNVMNQWKLQAENTADAKRGKTCNGCRARENMQRVLSAGEHATGAKSRKLHNGTAERGAKCGKQETGAMLEKTCLVPSAWQHVPVPSAENTQPFFWLVRLRFTIRARQTQKSRQPKSVLLQPSCIAYAVFLCIPRT